jgi:hypothetical protein
MYAGEMWNRTYRGCRFLLVAVLCVTGFSQTRVANSPPPVATIPLQPYLRAQATVEAVVNGQPGTFMFDTGEGVSSFTPEFVTKIGCRPWGRITGFRMSGERLDHPHCDGILLKIAGERVTAPVISVIDIMKFLGPGVPPIDGSLGLDIFAGKVITIIPGKAIILESASSLKARIQRARELPIRIVRDVEGIALSVDGAVQTSDGTAWMELDTGNGGSLVIANHIAPLVGLQPDLSTPTPASFYLENGIRVSGMARTRDLIMDGNIGAQFLNQWILTLDLLHGKAWLSPADARDSLH